MTKYIPYEIIFQELLTETKMKSLHVTVWAIVLTLGT